MKNSDFARLVEQKDKSRFAKVTYIDEVESKISNSSNSSDHNESKLFANNNIMMFEALITDCDDHRDLIIYLETIVQRFEK